MEIRTLIPVFISQDGGANNGLAFLASVSDALTDFVDTANENLKAPLFIIGQLNDGTTLTLLYLATVFSSGGETTIRAGTVPVADYATPGSWTWQDIALTSADFGAGFAVLSGHLIAAADSILPLDDIIALAGGGLELGIAYLLGTGAPPPPPPSPSVSPSGGGGGGIGGVGGALGSGMFGGGRFKCCTSGHEFQQARLLEAVRQSVKRKEAWPYYYEFPPASSIPVHAIGSAASPAVGVVAPVLVYLVPEGFRFILEEILQDFQGAAINPNDALWTVDRDVQPPNPRGLPINGLAQTPIPLGSIPRGVKWPLPRAYEFAPLTVLRSTVVNVNLGVGLPNQFVSGFFGYLLPAVANG